MIKSKYFILEQESKIAENLTQFNIIDENDEIIKTNDYVNIESTQVRVDMMLYNNKWCVRFYPRENHAPKGLVCYDTLTNTIY